MNQSVLNSAVFCWVRLPLMENRTELKGEESLRREGKCERRPGDGMEHLPCIHRAVRWSQV